MAALFEINTREIQLFCCLSWHKSPVEFHHWSQCSPKTHKMILWHWLLWCIHQKTKNYTSIWKPTSNHISISATIFPQTTMWLSWTMPTKMQKFAWLHTLIQIRQEMNITIWIYPIWVYTYNETFFWCDQNGLLWAVWLGHLHESRQLVWSSQICHQ